MSITDQIRDIQNENDKGLFDFEVEAWSKKDKPFTIYFKKFTLSDVTWVEKQSAGDKGRSLAFTVIRKALKADGEKMFTLQDLRFLTIEVKSSVVVHIVNQMNKIDQDIDYGKE